MMKKHYKLQFEDYTSKYKYKKKVKYISKAQSEEYFREFITDMFKLSSDIIAEFDMNDLVESFETIVLCDRYNK